MRILFLTNLYPPFAHGGHEIECSEVRSALEERGHSTAVLTSTHGSGRKVERPDRVYRWLNLEMALVPVWNSVRALVGVQRREHRNHQRLQKVVLGFRPDLIFVWGMWNLPRSLAVHAEGLMPGRVVYRLADYWPTLPSQVEVYWQRLEDSGPKRVAKQVLRVLAQRKAVPASGPQPRFSHVICVSEAVKKNLLDHGIPIPHAQVIHCGIHVDDFYRERRFEDRLLNGGNPGLKLLCAGRLSPEKGVDTAIRALGRLVRLHRLNDVRLTILGSGKAGYETHLQELAHDEGVTGFITLVPQIPRQEVPYLMHQSDLFVFPSTWQEPFSRVVLEAMASGLAVVGTTTGGTREVLVEGKTGLTFAPGDATALSTQLIKLRSEPRLLASLARAAQKLVLDRFEFEDKVGEIERYLEAVHRKATPNSDAKRG